MKKLLIANLVVNTAILVLAIAAGTKAWFLARKAQTMVEQARSGGVGAILQALMAAQKRAPRTPKTPDAPAQYSAPTGESVPTV